MRESIIVPMQMALETQKFCRKLKFGAQIHFGEKSLKNFFWAFPITPCGVIGKSWKFWYVYCNFFTITVIMSRVIPHIEAQDLRHPMVYKALRNTVNSKSYSIPNWACRRFFRFKINLNLKDVRMDKWSLLKKVEQKILYLKKIK